MYFWSPFTRKRLPLLFFGKKESHTFCRICQNIGTVFQQYDNNYHHYHHHSHCVVACTPQLIFTENHSIMLIGITSLFRCNKFMPNLVFKVVSMVETSPHPHLSTPLQLGKINIQKRAIRKYTVGTTDIHFLLEKFNKRSEPNIKSYFTF